MTSKYRFMLITAPLVAVIVWTVYLCVNIYVNNSNQLLKDGANEQTRVRPEVPLRGNIISSDGQMLALTVPAYRVQVNLAGLTVTEAAAIEPLVNLLTPALGMPAQDLRERLIQSMKYENLKSGVSILALAVPESKIKALGVSTVGINAALTPTITYSKTINGKLREVDESMAKFISIFPVSKREYPNGTLAGPVIGSTGYTETIVVSGFSMAFLTEGRTGLEAAFDDELKGAIGYRKGRSPLDRTVLTKTVPGANIITTLDSNVQAMAERMLDQAYQKYKLTGGSIIVMDIKTGDIFAMAGRTERPAFDPNKPIQEWEETINPAISGAMSQQPGSVIKPIVVASAIEYGRAIESFDDPGTMIVRGTRISNYLGTSYGKVDLMKLFLHSINTYVVKNAQSLGPELFYQQYQKFGLNEPTGIELKQEDSPGYMIVKGDKAWTEAVMATDAFGQSMSASPLQILRAFAALGNDGIVVQPRLVREIDFGNGARKIMLPGPQHSAVGPAAAQRTLGLLRDSIAEKIRQDKLAGRNLGIPGYTYAGKTGTSQWYKKGVLQDTHLVSFAGMVPANEPRLAIFVKLNEPKVNASTEVLAGTTALPVWRDVAEQAVKLLNIPPDTK